MLDSQFLFLGFDPCLSFRVGTIDNGQSQIKEEKRANKHQGYEVEENERCVGLLVHHHDVTPAFKRDALEHIKERPEDIVKICHIVVWVQGLLATVVARWTLVITTDDFCAFVVQK